MNNSKKEIKLIYNEKMFPTKNNNELVKAAKLTMKEIDRHFKKDKWDLDFNFQVEEVFYKAFGEHLENYLIKELFLKPKKGYYVVYSDKKGTVIRKRNINLRRKNGKSNKKK